MNRKEFWKISSPLQKKLYLIYIISFSIATSTHIRDLLLGGFLPYAGKPLWANIYWTSLTLLDPLAILLLLFRLRTGMILYAFIIVTDVLINLYFTISLAGISGVYNIYMMGQLFFLFFLILTWKSLKMQKN